MCTDFVYILLAQCSEFIHDHFNSNSSKDATLPEIINTFRPVFDPSRNEVVITARNSTYTTTVIIMGQQPVDNPPLLSTAANISCKAKGGPVATITWSRTDSDGNIMMLEEPDFSIFVPQAGRSVVTVPLPPQQTACVTYTCSATNFVGSVFGTVEVCPICKSMHAHRINSNFRAI